MKAVLFAVLGLLAMAGTVRGTTFSDDFDQHADLAAVSAAGWQVTSPHVTLESVGCRSGKCLRVNIPSGGTLWYLMHSLNEAAPYIRFFAKRTNFPGSGGNKFLKLFGTRSGTNYANITFGQVYQSGQFYAFGTGDGSGVENDTQCTWNWGPHAIGCSGTTVLQGGTLDMEDGRWYEFQFQSSPNTDGNTDGVVRIWVDGVLRVHYRDMKTRNDANVRNYENLSLVNYSDFFVSPYQIWIDDFAVSQAQIAPISRPKSPLNLKVR